ncbi:hypothetical protein DFH11DRAFT_45950 [Phellopilus nigrolimitatus]|nr:hypothetical protein DFH11DRAFT_45950 [Phellopilus nigrolimitatus]
MPTCPKETPLRQPPSPLTPFSASSTDSQLVPPQPPFTTPSRRNSNRSSAQVSVISSADGSDIGSYPPQRHQSTTALPVILPPEDRTPVQDAAGDTTAQQPLPSQPSRGRARPLSIATSTSSVNTSASKKTARSSRSLSTIRGAPHGIHSKIEIVLPSPLASQSQQYISPTKAAAYLHPEMGEGTTDLASNSMQSMCDPWIRVGRDSTSNTMGLPRHGQVRRSHIGDFETHTGPRSRSSRLSISSSSSQTTSNGASSALYTSRSSSVSSRSHSPRKASVELARLPPVPRVPSVYYNAASSSPHSPAATSPESNLDEGLLATHSMLRQSARRPKTSHYIAPGARVSLGQKLRVKNYPA